MSHAHRSQTRTSVTAVMALVALTAAFAGIGTMTTTAATAPRNTALVGSWIETVTFPPEAGRPPLKSLMTAHADGTMVCSDQGAVTAEGVFTSCHGVWTHLSDRTFAYTAVELISDASGNLVGYLKARGQYTLSASGDEYTGATLAQILDPAGNVLLAVDVTNAGERIRVEQP